MQLVKDYVKGNSSILFKGQTLNNQLAIFDSKGFYLSDEAQLLYDKIKNQPHIYVAWTKSKNGYYYVGKSFQIGGRWKRQHAYHLGTLAHHLLNNIRYDDQNHSHWIDHWMHADTIIAIDDNTYMIELKQLVYICFIPFNLYSNYDNNTLEKSEIRNINTMNERLLIESYQNDGITLLNVIHNSKYFHSNK